MMDLILKLSGAALVVLVMADIFLTALYARNNTGILVPRLNKVVWCLMRWIAGRQSGPRKDLLTFAGPLLLVLIVFLWATLLMLGFGVIFWTELGETLVASSGKTDVTFATAFYYSGYCLTTLGTGDITPKTSGMRLLSIFESATGFSVLTLSLTFLMSVYNSVIQRNAFALHLHLLTRESGDAVKLLTGLHRQGNKEDEIGDMTRQLLSVLEAHHSYPILHYFRFKDPHYSMNRMLVVSLDAVSLIRSALDRDVCRDLIECAATSALWRACIKMLEQIPPEILTDRYRRHLEGAPASEQAVLWRKRFEVAAREMRAAGMPVRNDLEQAAEDYVELRSKWNPPMEQTTRYMALSWAEVDAALRPFIKPDAASPGQ